MVMLEAAERARVGARGVAEEMAEGMVEAERVEGGSGVGLRAGVVVVAEEEAREAVVAKEEVAVEEA